MITDFLIYILSLVTFVNSRVFTSVSKLEELALTEQNMLSALGTYIRDAETSGIFIPDNINLFYNKMSNTSSHTLQPHFMENPINAYHFIRRMHVTWSEIISTIDCEHCDLSTPLQEFKTRLRYIATNLQYGIKVSEEDMQWAALGIVRLWQTYKLHLPSLFRGEILGTVTISLDLDDILYICQQLEDKGELYKEIIWLQGVLGGSVDSDIQISSKNKTRITRMLAGAYAKYRMPWVSVELIEKHIEDAEAYDLKKLKRDLAFYTMKMKEVTSKEQNILKPRDEDVAKSHYEALCRGDVPRKTKVLSRLRCIYRKTDVPVYRVREEILNYSPRISLFHDVLTEPEIEGVKQQAMASLKASRVTGSDEKRNPLEFKYRVSQTAWLADDTSDLIDRVSRRVQLITGLSTRQYQTLSHAEHLQVLNYGVGGMYEAHEDYFDALIHSTPIRAADPHYVRGTGDRMATWMFYLNDVRAGGATVFVHLNITVSVEKGAAVFWYNIKRNGELDPRTKHAGCPVLLGSKWVANKWIRQQGQIFRRKCGRRINSLDLPLG